MGCGKLICCPLTAIYAPGSDFANNAGFVSASWLIAAGFFPLNAPPAPLAFPTDKVVLGELRAGKIGLVPDSAGFFRGRKDTDGKW